MKWGRGEDGKGGGEREGRGEDWTAERAQQGNTCHQATHDFFFSVEDFFSVCFVFEKGSHYMALTGLELAR